MITPDFVIDSLGGTKSVASELSLALSTVSCWRIRGIPAGHWRSLVRFAAERGVDEITLEALSEMDGSDAVEVRA